MRSIKYIRTMPELRALMHPLRLAIVRTLQTSVEPLSATQLSTRLDEAANKLHYHLVEMERHGFVRLVKTERRGILTEKHYAPTARWVRIAPAVLSDRKRRTSSVQTTVEAMLELTYGDLTTLFADPAAGSLSERVLSLHSAFRLTPTDAAELRDRLRALLREYVERKVDDGEDLNVTVFAYPPVAGAAPTTRRRTRRAPRPPRRSGRRHAK